MSCGPANRPCPLCGSTDNRLVLTEANYDPAQLGPYAFASRKLPEYMHHRLIECPHCALLYASPVPDTSNLQAAYRDAGFDSAEEARWASHTYIGLVNSNLQKLRDRVGALDIGTGDGAFLHRLLEAGFSNVHGVEPSSAPIAGAHPSIRPLIHQCLFSNDLFPDRHFRLVTCFQTIEHVPDPLGLCRAAHRVLKPGGVLMLVGHNRRAYSARLLGKKSPIFDIEHLQLFSVATMRRLLQEAGFTQCIVRPIVNRYPLHYWVKLFPLPRSLKVGLIAGLKRLGVGHLPLALPGGNLMGIGYRHD